MDKTFLSTDPNKEQHFLRAKGHPFGRYENHVPFFRGIPPYIVHFFFIQALLSTDTPLDSINFAQPGEIITLHVLLLLHQALTQRSSTLPLTLTLEPASTAQRFAKSYRDGQARIIHAVRAELESAINALRVPPHQPLPARSALLSLPNGLAALRAEYPDAAAVFERGVQKHNLLSPATQSLKWTLLLIIYASLILTNTHNASGTNAPLLASLTAAHALPALEDGIDDLDTYTFLDAHLGDFVALPGQAARAPTEVLDRLGLMFVAHDDAAFVPGPTRDLGARLLMWGMRVQGDAVVRVLGEMCLFVGMGRGEWLGGA